MLEQKGNVFVDVGAYEGFYSLNLSRNFNRIICYEPYPEKADYIKEQIEKYGIKNVEVRQKALSNYEGAARFNVSGIFLSRNSLKDIKNIKETITVNVTTLALDLDVLADIDLVKIDVEGEEFEVIEGLMPIIDRVKKLIVEVHDTQEILGYNFTTYENRRSKMKRVLEGLGFKTEWLTYQTMHAYK
ncbi:MAG: FkbM family methyltransferase [Caldisericum exile]|uniref:FkbM family methyltransferase n=1 Tax=Caldisericum exile TaxID=693075 RepID=UPI003C793B80